MWFASTPAHRPTREQKQRRCKTKRVCQGGEGIRAHKAEEKGPKRFTNPKPTSASSRGAYLGAHRPRGGGRGCICMALGGWGAYSFICFACLQSFIGLVLVFYKAWGGRVNRRPRLVSNQGAWIRDQVRTLLLLFLTSTCTVYCLLYVPDDSVTASK